MTKLFSLKSLAFAGAAACAVALAAAPQADAAETGKAGIAIHQYSYEVVDKTISREEYDKLEPGEQARYREDKKSGKYNSYKGVWVDDVTAGSASIVVSSSAVTVTDNKIELYYAAVKNGKTPKKWKSILLDVGESDDGSGVSVYDYGDYNYANDEAEYLEHIDSYLVSVPIGEFAKGKAMDIFLSADADGTMKVGPMACKAAPKLKAQLNTADSLTTGPSITLKSGSSELSTGEYTISSPYSSLYHSGEVSTLAKGSDGLSAFLTQAANLGGGTFTVTYYDVDSMVPSGTTKLKIAGTKEAPKITLKIAKKFSWKLKNTIQYRAYVAGEKEPDWAKGTGSDLTMEALFGKDNVSTAAIGFNSEYPLMKNMTVQMRTAAAGNKAASKVATTTVYASSPAPTTANAIISNDVKTKGTTMTTGASVKFVVGKLETTQNSATTSGAAVSSGAIVTLQYSENGTKWTDVKTGKETVTFKSGKVPGTLYVRVKGIDAAAANTKKGTKAQYYEAASYIMKITLNSTNPEKDSVYEFNGITATHGGIIKK